ncbi:hypothetical protein A4R26_23855 [Niastella populi]|uniref:Uncharacterized protein n=1 Tax=Niastella populi TaxID=550983 RepID=A0A1V9FGT5_9BACT|nr:hypothetical protein A4R26_23855 [Niastella populi]
MADGVVVGYGRQKKVNLAGVAGTVNVDEKIATRSVPKVSAGLSGLVPGLAADKAQGIAGRNSAACLFVGWVPLITAACPLWSAAWIVEYNYIGAAAGRQRPQLFFPGFTLTVVIVSGCRRCHQKLLQFPSLFA